MNETLSYDFVAPPKIVFGWGRRREVGTLGRTLGRRAMILSGLPAAVAADVLGEIRELLSTQDIEPTLVETILHEPEVQDVDRVARELRGNAANRGCFLLAIGGGAAIDLAKAAAVVATNRQSPTVADYLENVGRGLKIVEPPLPVLAMPTTAGTGRRGDPQRGHFVVRSALQEESSRRPHPAADRPGRSGADGPRAAGGDRGQRHGRDHATHRKLHLAEGPADSPGPGGAGTAAGGAGDCRGGGERPFADGAGADVACGAALRHGAGQLGAGAGPRRCPGPGHPLPRAARHGLRRDAAGGVADQSRGAAGRIGHAGPACSSASRPRLPDGEAVDALIEKIEALCRRVGVPPRLADLGVRHDQIPALVKSSRGQSMSGNPRDVSDAELTRLLEKML